MSPTRRRQPARSTPRTLLRVVLTVLIAAPLSLLGTSAAEATDHSPAASHRRTQQVSLQLLPGLRQPGPSVAPSTAARILAVVQVEPPSAHRSVVLFQRAATGWRQVSQGSTDASGKAELWAARGGDPVYRAVTPPWRGLDAAQSQVTVSTWSDPDFVDEFDEQALGPAWEHRIQFYNPWGGRACSKGSPEAIAVSGGSLRLSSMPDPTTSELCPAANQKGEPLGSYPYRLNGHVSTQHSADFLYGVAAARMRFPKSLGQHAALWLQPRGLLETGTTPWGAEIDVVEWYGAGRRADLMASAVHEPLPDGAKRQIGGRIPRTGRFLASEQDAWWARFHVFSVEWTPEEYIFRIGAHEVWRTDQGVSDVPEFLILSMLSSDFELPAVGSDPTARTAEVDWVAFWQAT